MSDGVTVVFEANCHQPGRVMASVWLFPGRIASTIGDSEEDLSSFPGARRVVGPVEFSIAEQAFKSITETLKTAGIPYDETDAADD